jgi:hypothetical protein
MGNQSGNQFDHGQYVGMKQGFFNQMGIGNDDSRTPINEICKKKPGGHAGGQPHNKGDIIRRLNLESDTENHPENKNHDSWLDKGPYKTQHRSNVLGGQLPLGHGENEVFL